MSGITTAEDAMRIANTFIDKYYPFYRLQSVRKEGDEWVVRYDVSVVGPKSIVIIRLDKNTGDLIEYTSND